MSSVILPPNTPLTDGRQLVRPEWYRYFVNIQKRIDNTDDATDNDQIIAGTPSSGAIEDLAAAMQDALLGVAQVIIEPEQDILVPPYQEPDAFDATATYRAATQTVATDANFAITPSVTGLTVRHTGTLTADRTITLNTTGARAGTQTQVTRSGAGAFNLSVGGLKNLATNTWALVEYNGSAWFLAAYGAL